MPMPARLRMPDVLLLAALVLAPGAAAGQAPDARVLLIGNDGVRVGMLARANTPTLDSLAAAAPAARPKVWSAITRPTSGSAMKT